MREHRHIGIPTASARPITPPSAERKRVRAMVTAGVLAALLLGTAGTARADSDGYYCAGPGYLAYELWFSVPGNRHVLHVIPLGAAYGIGAPDSVVLPIFQVHGMRCKASRVDLLGWDSVYTVDLSQSPLTYTTSVIPWNRTGTSREALAAYPSVNLAEWSRAVHNGRPDTTALAIRDVPERFVLIVDVAVDTTQSCMYDVHTTLVDLAPTPHGIPKRSLFLGKADMECGE